MYKKKNNNYYRYNLWYNYYDCNLRDLTEYDEVQMEDW